MWNRERLAAVLVKLKTRIKGGFKVESIDGEKVVLVNDRCPFAERVLGRESLCQMTTAVFGRVTANALGEGQVFVEKSIARGDGYCRVIVYFSPDPLQAGSSFFRDEL